MRQTPLVQFFDEPTASLDAPTEHALFEGVASASHLGAAAGDHGPRLAPVLDRRSADLILVVVDGSVGEWGSHDTLMDQAGLYAEFYTMQAASYR